MRRASLHSAAHGWLGNSPGGWFSPRTPYQQWLLLHRVPFGSPNLEVLVYQRFPSLSFLDLFTQFSSKSVDSLKTSPIRAINSIWKHFSGSRETDGYLLHHCLPSLMRNNVGILSPFRFPLSSLPHSLPASDGCICSESQKCCWCQQLWDCIKGATLRGKIIQRVMLKGKAIL